MSFGRPLSCRRFSWLAFALAVQLALGARAGAQEAEPTGPFLWRIEREPPSYLFGTLHLPDERLLQLHPQVRRAIDHADVVYTEVLMDAETQAEALRRAVLPGSRTLKDVLPADLLAETQDYIASRSLPFAPFSRMRVWAVASALPLLPWLERNQRNEVLDEYLASRARQRGARTEALETIATQIGAIESMGHEGEIALLRDTLRQLREGASRGVDPSEELLQVYLRGDLRALEAAAFDPVKLDPVHRKQLMEALLYKRNEGMAAKIRAALEREPKASHFFAAGALHFAGERSVVALLRDAGLRVERTRWRASRLAPGGAIAATR